MSSDFPTTKQEIINRIKSMVFLCMYCNSPNPIALSVVDFDNEPSGPSGTAFFICPECQNKFMVKIQDLGRVRR